VFFFFFFSTSSALLKQKKRTIEGNDATFAFFLSHSILSFSNKVKT